MTEETTRVLLIDDDKDYKVIVQNLLSMARETRFELQWTPSAEEAYRKLKESSFDVCLLDYRLGSSDGLHVLREIARNGFDVPVIFLTGFGSCQMDRKAMRLGAADYVDKNQLEPAFLEHCIRYAIDRTRTITALQESRSQLRRLSARLLEAQETERKRLSRELHDSLGSTLTAVRYALEQKVSAMSPLEEAPDGMTLEQIIEMVKVAVEETQRITSSMRPSVLDDLGLAQALRSLGREFSEILENVEIETQMCDEEDIPESLKIVVYRIAQEALNNAAKHSGAQKILLTTGKTENGFALLVIDDGCGFEPAAFLGAGEDSEGGMGLQNMRERAEISNGFFQIRSEKGKGTAIRVDWPIGAD
ncbi:MAG TPA: response regulator [Syntrophales bacterium]|nr:response regulator [Syntrophales bacterium]